VVSCGHFFVIRHPYPGLRPFSRDEDAIFFGREDQVDQLLDKLEQTHFIAVVGISGSGKSSLVRAGLLPALDSGFMAGAGPRWTMAELRPGDRPFHRLAASLVQDTAWGNDVRAANQRREEDHPQLPDEGLREDRRRAASVQTACQRAEVDDTTDVDQFIARLEHDLRRGNLAMNWRLGVQPLPADTRLLILVDQFEELFRYQQSAGAEAAAFVSLLLGAASHPDVYIVITLRSEFLGDCALYPELPEAVNAGLFLTPRLTPEQTADAIQLPARIFGGEVERALVRRLLAEAKGENDQLPLLQHALMRLWDLDAGSKLLTVGELNALRGLRQALQDHAEEAYGGLDPDQRRIAEVLFRSLTQRGPEERDTRRPVPLGEVAELAGAAPSEVAAVVEVFRQPGRSFLMPFAGTPLDHDTVLDIAHEALIRQWSRLRDWTADEAERAELYLRLTAAADRWQDGKGALWVDPDLEYALQWRERTRPDTAWAARYGGNFGLSMAFLDAGHDQRERRRRDREDQRRKALRRAQTTATIAFLGLAIVAGVAGWGWLERQHALETEQQRTRDLFNSGLTHSALLSRTEDYAEAKRVLGKTRALDLKSPPTRRLARDLLSRYTEILGGAPEKTYRGPGPPLSQAALSPDGRWLAACGERGTVILFEAESGELLYQLRGHDPDEQIRDAHFHPEGRWLASAGNDRQIIVWSLPEEGRAPNILRQWWAPEAVMSLAVSPDGQLLAAGGEDGAITLWDPGTGTPLRTLRGHAARIAEVTGLAFSPNGERLASASDDGTARLWDVATGAEIVRLDAHREHVKGVAFSADGNYLATGGNDKRVVLWKLEARDAVRVFTGHRNMVYGLAFAERTGEPTASPLLIAGGFDRTLRVWDIDSAATVRLLQGHTAAVNGITVRGTKLYSAGSDGTVRRWDLSLPHQRLLDVPGEPASAAVSPDGRFLALGFADGALHLHSLPDLALLWADSDAHTADLQRLAFSADGSRLASGGFDNRARIWRVLPIGALEALHTLEGHDDAVHAVAFSPDGRILATAGYDGRIGLFDTSSGEGRFIESTQGQVVSIAFDRTGRLVYSADRDDRRIRVWEIGQTPPFLARNLEASRDLLLWAEPDAASAQIAAVGRDYVVSILDTLYGNVLHRLPGHENAVFKARFLPGGGQLATVSVDATVRLWDLATESELFSLRLPANQGQPTPLWDFDLRCTPTGCWLAVPLTRGKLALYNFGKSAAS
jgi:WD40 repeat protein